jgi:hypothetical protein
MLPFDPTILLACWIPLAGILLALCIGPEPEDDYCQSPTSSERANELE